MAYNREDEHRAHAKSTAHAKSPSTKTMHIIQSLQRETYYTQL